MYLRSPRAPIGRWRRLPATLFFLCALLLVLCSCGGGSGNLILTNGQPTLASNQSLSIPIIGTVDVPSLDPARSLDQSGKLLMSMFYSGLVRQGENFQISQDQASWDISNSGKTYTFHLKSGVTFADGSPVTAQSYVDSWTRALTVSRSMAQQSSALSSSDATPPPYILALPISGAQAVLAGNAQTLSGVQAVDDQTLRVNLTQATPTFLQSLAQPFFFPVNDRLVDVYGEQNWPATVAKEGIGTGPFVIKEWDRDEKMILVPNAHYYGPKLTLSQLTVYFMNDARVSYSVNRAGSLDMTWGMVPVDQQAARKLQVFQFATALQTDALFFDTSRAPFNAKKMREAFALALDKQSLAHVIMNDTIVPAETLFPPAMAGYQPGVATANQSINKITKEPVTFDPTQARQLFKEAANTSAITFTYPQSALTPVQATAMQAIWKQNLGVHVAMRPLEDNAYAHELSMHSIQFGLYSWTALTNDPSDFADRLLSHSPQNAGNWQNDTYDQTVAQADASSGSDRLQLYHQAEQIALNDMAVVPLSHDILPALLGVYIQGMTINAEGIYVGDWSQVKVLNHKP